MLEKIKKNLWTLMTVLIVVCAGIIAFSGYRYLSVLWDTLEDNELQHMMDMAQTQKNAVDSYLSEDQERLHNCAVYLSQTPVFDRVQDMLIPFLDTSAEEYTVVCFDEGVMCSSLHDEIIRLTPSQLEEIGSFTGSGMRDDFVGMFSGERSFSCYENFTFNSGHHGMIQKRYNWDAFSGLFSLSVHGSQGRGYLLDKNGNILCRADADEQSGGNIFDELIGQGCSRETVNDLRTALGSGKTGSDTLTAGPASYAYSYIPLESASGWYLLSIVPTEAIETDVGAMMTTLQMSMVVLPLLMVIGCMLFMLAWNNNKRGRDIAAKDKELYDQGQSLEARDRDIAAMDREIVSRDRDIAAMDKEITSRDRALAARDRELAARDRELAARDRELVAKDRDIETRDKDIEDQAKRLEYEAQQFETIVAYLSSSSNDVYVILNEGREVTYATPNLERVTGRTEAEITAGLQRADHSSDTEEYREFVRRLRTMTPGGSAGPVIRELVDPSTGKRRFLLDQAVCVRIQDEVKIVVYVSDQTHEFKSRENLADALRQAQDANNAKSEFLRNVSHDMRTPMNAIIGFLGLMRDEVDDPDAVREYARQIDTASQHLLGLINNVLDMSKVESGEMRLKLSELDLTEMIEEIKTTITPQVQAKDQTFEVSVSQLTHEHLRGDKTRTKAILLNLLSNAVKYTPEGGAIRLRVEELPQVAENFCRIRFEVEDNGVGMSQDYQDSAMFTPFSREDTQVNRETEGSGLGLAVTKGLVDLMGGGIRVKSAPGKGSTFTVELDMRILPQDKDAVQRTMGSDASADVIRGKRALIVDDIEINRIVLTKIMNTLGAQCDTAAGGQEALEKFETSQPGAYDLILMDLQMPVLDGCGAARAIRACDHPSARSIPIIAVSANAFADDVRAALDSGMNAHIAKPIQADQLKSLLQRVLEGQEPIRK